MGQLQEIHAQLRELGYQIIAISQDGSESIQKTEKKLKLEYPVVSDAGLKASTAFGLTFRVDEETVKLYKNYGIELVEWYGKEQPEMPVPAVFLTGKDGKIVFSYVNPAYQVRIPAELVLAAAKAFQNKE